MKDQILKIAKVKSEKEFYKKYPTEEAFMKAHGKAFKKAAMGAKMVNDQLHQLSDFGNPAEAQDGGMFNIANAISSAFTKPGKPATATSAATPATGGFGDAIVGLFGGDPSKISNVGPKGALGTDGAGFTAGAEAAGMGILNAAPQILQGVGQIKQQQANIKKADQFAQLSGVTAQAAESQPGIVKHKYVRDQLVQPGQLGNPQGNNTNYLSAQNGRMISGNPTEIQNTYAPGDLYVGLGYEPLNDSNPKQYAYGGNIPTAEFGDYFQDSGQASIGKGVGSAIGSAFFGPLGGQVGGFLGGVAGNLLGGADDANKLARLQDVGKKNTERAAWATGANAIHSQNAAFMKDGGYIDDDHAWVSNSWQPQVITKFGEYNVSDLLKPPHDADMLRAGGHLREYTPPSAAAMYTGRDKYAMGGELKTTWGGKAEPMSYNPYLPGTGETVMFRGQSHDETNGKGQSGIGVKYGNGGMTDYAEYGASDANADVEVERGEPAMELIDPVTGEKNLNVSGNMLIPPYGVKAIGDKKAKGKKFKNYVADLSKQEAKHNKAIEKATDIINNANGNDPFDQLSLNAGKAIIMGSNLKLKNIAEKKKNAAIVQNAILDTAEEFNVESDGLAKGKLRAIKDPSIGRDGKKLSKAQDGTSLANFLKTPFAERKKIAKNLGFSDYTGRDSAQQQKLYKLFKESNSGAIYNPPTAVNLTDSRIPDYSFITPKSAIPFTSISNIPTSSSRPVMPASMATSNITGIDIFGNPTDRPEPLSATSSKTKGEGFGWKDATGTALTMYPFFRPTNQVPLDPSQLTGEMYALGNNQVEPVQAQLYNPMLDQPYDISLQDQLNAIDSQGRAAILAAGQDPAAQAYIMSQVSDAKNKVLGEQFRANQANKAAVYQANRQALNQAQLQNLGILDKQYERQETAKSKTKAQTVAALNSISDKIAKNKLLNRQLGIYENLYGFRFDDKGRAYNINNPYQFNMSGSGKTSASSYAALNSALGKNKRITTDPITGEVVGIRTLTKDEMDGTDSSALIGAANLGLLSERNGGKTKKSKNGSIVKAIKNL